ncbi:metallophosphoesterase [Sorangium sp. So ce590]|uniref:metallophosphoesterase n=1 Tax=Sorangium sp. So ce590 TaxID=3133317 RepID=UPI003F5F0440
MDGAARDIFVISDLHIGDGGARDNFDSGKKTPQLRAFLDHVGSEGGELFVLGDFFELWQMNLSLLLVKRRALLDQLATLRLVYVPGNHDIDLAHFIDTDFLHHPFFACMRAPFVRELGDRRFRFCHGHETDPFNAGDDPGFGRMLSIFAGVFEDQNGSPLLTSGESVEDVLEQFGDSMLTIWKRSLATVHRSQGATKEVRPTSELTPAQNPDRLGEHVVGVRAELDKGEYDVTVLGHTHKPGRIGDWYFNSGSWTGPRNSFLRISPDGHVRYLEWKDGHAIEREMPVVLPEAGPGRAPAAPKNPVTAAMSAARTLFPKPTRPERSRWVLIAQGVLAISVGAGVLTISVGQGSSAGWRVLVSAFAAYALVDGALSLFGASREPTVRRLLSLVRGVASLLLGLVVLRRGYMVEVFVILVGIWAFISGALRVAASVVLKGMVESRWLFAVGAGSMLASLVLLSLPASAVLLKFALAGYLCYYGGGELLAGIFGQRASRTASLRPAA